MLDILFLGAVKFSTLYFPNSCSERKVPALVVRVVASGARGVHSPYSSHICLSLTMFTSRLSFQTRRSTSSGIINLIELAISPGYFPSLGKSVEVSHTVPAEGTCAVITGEGRMMLGLTESSEEPRKKLECRWARAEM